MTLLDAVRPGATDARTDQQLVDDIAWTFRESCIAAGCAVAVDSPIAGTGFRTPTIAYVELGPPMRMSVRMLPGQIPADLARVGRQIAPHLGGRVLRVEDRGLGWALVTVLVSDPLAASVPLDMAAPGVLLGRTEDARMIRIPHARDLPHMIIQGQTRSGKSIFTYALIAQIARESDCVIAGVDPSGITLRPLTHTRHGQWLENGLSDPAGIVDTLLSLVSEMDRRLAEMPFDRDILPTDDETPVIVVVLDEYPALLRALDGLKTKDHDPGKIVRTLVARMLAESHKVGFRVVLIAQRAEASIVGAAERAQCAGRLSFRVDSPDSIKLLHPDGAEMAAEHTSAPPGIALLSWPGEPLTRVRGPFIGGYGEYLTALGALPPAGPLGLAS